MWSGGRNDETLALLDELERRIEVARHGILGRVRLNRKETVELVEAVVRSLGYEQGVTAAIDELRGALAEHKGTAQQLVARTYLMQALSDLDTMSRYGGQGGALYAIRYLNVKRKRLESSIDHLRRALEFNTEVTKSEQWN